MATQTGTDNMPYVVVTNSGGVSEIAEVGGKVETLHIDYDDCNSETGEARRYADDVVEAAQLWLPEERARYYLSEIFGMHDGELERYLAELDIVKDW